MWYRRYGGNPAGAGGEVPGDLPASGGYSTRAWKAGLAALAVETGLEITCCHFPPGTSKWKGATLAGAESAFEVERSVPARMRTAGPAMRQRY